MSIENVDHVSTTRISVELPGMSDKLEWLSRGAEVIVEDGKSETTIYAFVLDRFDNPFKRRWLPSHLSADRVIMPRVLRTIDPSSPDAVTDYVYDPLDLESVVSIYDHDRVINDVRTYLYGEWPIPHSFITGDDGRGRIRMLAETVLHGVGFLGTVVESEATISYRNHAAINSVNAGTAPLQPVRLIE